MPLDGLTLGFLARELNTALQGGRVDKITQPFGDMLVLSVRVPGRNLRLMISAGPAYTRLHLTDKQYENPQEAPMFLMLMRKHLSGARIQAIRQVGGDRLIRIDMTALNEMGDEKEKTFYFEAMGRHTNLTLVQDGIIIDAIRHVTHDMSRVRQMLPGLPFVMPPAQEKLAPEEADEEKLSALFAGETGRLDKLLAEKISGLSAASAREIACRLTGQETPLTGDIASPDLYKHMAALLQSLPGLFSPRLVRDGEGLPMEALPFPFITRAEGEAYATLSEAVETLFFERDRHDRMQQKAGALRRLLQNALSRCENRIAAQEEELRGALTMEGDRVAGELLTAFGHMVEKGAKEAELPNYYDGNKPVSVKLDPALSPAQNAQKYFKKYRKANVARHMAGEQIEKARAEMDMIEEALYFMEDAGADLASVRRPLVEAGILKPPKGEKKNKKPLKEGQPMRFVTSGGFTVLVGKNSGQNMALLRDAGGQDLWLHAKDVPGSHVILRTEGREPLEEDILAAASLAAYYSKGRGGRVPVDVCRRRYVKKTAGAAMGHVTFTNNRTLLAEGKEPEGLRGG